MIRIVPEPDSHLNSDDQPQILVPMSADDDARRKARVRWAIGIAAAIFIAVVICSYKLYMDPLNARESFDAGSRLYKIARYNQAILSFDRAIALQPKMADAYFMRAKCFVGDAKPESSLADYSKYISLRPSDPAGYVARGLAYLDLNKIDQTVADATKAIELNPKLASAYNLRGSAIRKGGDAKRALEDFNHAVEYEPSADNLYQRGATYQLLGEHRLAIADFDKVIEIIPDLGNAFYARAASKRAIGDLKGAEADHHQGRVLDGK
jgi:tetratricopeptide (TPR) repeat protein